MSFFSKAFIINGMENYNFDIQEELKKLPAKPGVYIMHDERDHIIYVGKAISFLNPASFNVFTNVSASKSCFNVKISLGFLSP